MKAYKLLRIKNGKLYPLFIHRKFETPMNIWMQAECYPTKGFAVRKGWHCCFTPYAPHLNMVLSNGEQRVWAECEIKEWATYNRPESQGGAWILAQKIKIIKTLQMEDVEKMLLKYA